MHGSTSLASFDACTLNLEVCVYAYVHSMAL